MINYIEKGIGLHQAIRAAGHWLRNENNEWVCDDPVAVQGIIDGYTLEQAKAIKCAEVSAQAKAARDKFIRTVSAGEMASWSIKLAEAVKFGATGDASQCPMLSAEALARGITVAQLVDKVNSNAAVFSGLEAEISGTDGRHRDAINALSTFDDVNAYDFSTGWPEV